MNQHTPGPWTVKGVHVGPSKHFRAYSIEPNICEMNSSLAPDDVSANARLIAAAPQLLEALKELIAEYDAMELTQGCYPNETGGMILARQAIAHATGEQVPR